MKFSTKPATRLLFALSALCFLAAFQGCGSGASQPSGAAMQDSMKSETMMKDGMMKTTA